MTCVVYVYVYLQRKVLPHLENLLELDRRHQDVEALDYQIHKAYTTAARDAAAGAANNLLGLPIIPDP